MVRPARWWHSEHDRIVCEVCPQLCTMPDGASGRCGARFAKHDKLWTNAWGVGTQPVADPVEKKPLNHFLPGSKVLSFGLPGCNLDCAFCQNWSLSTGRNYGDLQLLIPENCVQLALEQDCSAIAFTYSEPTISTEFCIDVSKAAHRMGIKTIAVSNGYIHGEARSELFDAIDAANIDLKSIEPEFYARHCGARLAPVLETLEYLARSRTTWFEVTNLLIPGLNDSESDLNRLSDWVCTHLGTDVPLHFSAFHPAHRMQELPRTPYDTLCRAKDIALAHGIRHVYLGNTSQPQSTLCPNCQSEVIRRVNYTVTKYNLLHGKCPECGTEIAGQF